MERRQAAVERELLPFGYQLLLGGTVYEITEPEGWGNNSVVYRAKYRDSLVADGCHEVLIKELFPYTPKGWISRSTSGDICCDPQGRELFEYHKKSFYFANQVNLSVLKKCRDQAAGNLNSYEAHGTYYSVLTLHGGETLARRMEAGRVKSLQEILPCIRKITEALQAFHESGYLHLDISPDNVLLMKERAILIDYNSAWPVKRKEGEMFPYSFKEGYTAPEVRLRDGGSIGAATDIYSVCAVFFHLLTGRRLEDKDARGRGILRALSATLPVFEDIPASAVYQTAVILQKGLHGIAARRYQSTAELLEALKELDARLSGFGVTKSTLWEGSRRQYLQGQRKDEKFWERLVAYGSERLDADTFFNEKLLQTGSVLITGGGGIGKTSLLKHWWGESVSRYRPDAPVVFYIPLAQYQEAGGEAFYIRRRLLEGIQAKAGGDAPMRQLNHLLAEEKEASWIFLLDGLNEAGGKRELLLKEAEGLAKLPGVRVLVTDRSAEVLKYAFAAFSKLALCPFSDEQAAAYLAACGISYPEDEMLGQILQNPMILSLYREITVMRREDLGEDAQMQEECHTLDDVVGAFFTELIRKQQRIYSGDEKMQLRAEYAIRQLLPQIAEEMKRQKKRYLSAAQMLQLLERDYRRVSSKAFLRAFPEYIGKTGKLRFGVKDAGEWLELNVRELLTEQMDLLVEDACGFRLIHENFSGYLTELGRAVRKEVDRARRKDGWKKGAVLLLAVCMLAGAGRAVQNRSFPSSKEEQNLVYNAFSCLSGNMQILDAQLYAQQELVEEAGAHRVLEGDASACEQFQESAQKRLEDLVRTVKRAGGGERYIEGLSVPENTVPLDVLQDLYDAPGQMQERLEENVGYLTEGICQTGSYAPQTRREALVKAYQDYLKACGGYLYLRYLQVILSVPGEYREDSLTLLAQSVFFSDYLVDGEYGMADGEELEVRLAAARKQLQKAEFEMAAQNYPAQPWIP